MKALSFTMARRLVRAAAAMAVIGGAVLVPHIGQAQSSDVPWLGYGGNAQHTALSQAAAQPLQRIRWQTPVDLQPQYSGNDLLIHYGSPLVTASNTVIVPVKVGATDGFRVEARRGRDGILLWTQTSNYSLPPHRWTPSFSPTLTTSNRLYIPAGGGTLTYRDAPDSANSTSSGPIVFYGLSNYNANPNVYLSRVRINTPLTADAQGHIFFGFYVSGSTPINLRSGIARLSPDGTGTWVAASTAAADSAITKVAHNCAPALSNDGSVLYVAVNSGNGTGSSSGYLLALDSVTLATHAKVRLHDASSGQDASLSDNGTASPTVGPDGDVYFGVLENPFPANHDRGWLLHFDSTLTTEKTPGAFGWDDTASIVPASIVPSYQGTSSYLLMTKYNNYAGGAGGDGVNRIAVLDPNDTQTDPVTGAQDMQEVLTIAGPTPDPQFPQLPNAVREWCINTAVVDPFTNAILANSEDGTLYRWDLTTNTLSESVVLTPGIGEAYTPTVIGPDGTVYAVNNGTLFAVGRRFPVHIKPS